MNLTWSETRRLWMNSLIGYQRLNRSIIWSTHISEIEDIFMKKFDFSLKISEQSNLFLIVKCSSDISFILETKHMRFPKINKVELWKLDMLPIYALNHISTFLKNCSQGKINELILKSDLHIDMVQIQKGLAFIVSNTIKIIKFENFSINQDVLCTIFNSLREAKVLQFTNWMIDIKPDFKINPDKYVDLETLDLKRSLIKDSNTYLNTNKLCILLNAISITPIKESLKNIIWKSDEYPHQEIALILLEFDLKCKIFQN